MLAPSRILRSTPAQAGGGRERWALVDQAEDMIAEGSKSFAMASMLFDRHTRERVWLLYAWCRRCDDIADDQHMGGALGNAKDKEDRVQAIRVLTRRALDGLPTADPAFDGLGIVAAECGLKTGFTTERAPGRADTPRRAFPRYDAEDLPLGKRPIVDL